MTMTFSLDREDWWSKIADNSFVYT